MKSWLSGVFFVVVAWPSMIYAQNWTAEEKEVLDTIKMCWDATVEAVQKDNPKLWLAKCRPAEDFSMWWTESGAPSGPDMWLNNWEVTRSRNPHWVDLRPLSIRIHGDVALVQFYGIWRVFIDGREELSEAKRTEVFRKVSGHWQFIGGQGTPVSAADIVPK